MHQASLEKMRAARDVYMPPNPERRLRVLDVGSMIYDGSAGYGELFPAPAYEYVGLDLAEGPNVSLVPDDPYDWAAVDSESFDVVISGSAFEHTPYFWITASEVARVLTQGGIAAIIAPSSGEVHRYPFDCWRFYPDSWLALCQYVGLELLESFIEDWSWRKVVRGMGWHDSMMIARKVAFADDDERSAFYSRLASIVATRTGSPVPSETGRMAGPAASSYERAHTLTVPELARTRANQLAKRLKRSTSTP